jgi:hypothetical protein
MGEAGDGDELLAAALGQLDDGADFVKLNLDGPDAATPPFTADEVARVVREGGPADFSLVHGDPLGDPTAMWRVWRVA